MLLIINNSKTTDTGECIGDTHIYPLEQIKMFLFNFQGYFLQVEDHNSVLLFKIEMNKETYMSMQKNITEAIKCNSHYIEINLKGVKYDK